MAPEACNDCNRLLYVIFESGVYPQVMELLDVFATNGFTLFEQIKGRGETGRKEGNAIFPGINMVAMVAMPEDKVAPLVAGLHEIRDSFIVTPGMKVIVTDCVMY